MVFCLPESVPTDLSSVMADMFPQTSCRPCLNHTPLISSQLCVCLCVCMFVPALRALIFPTCFHLILVCSCAYTLYHIAFGVLCVCDLRLCAFPHTYRRYTQSIVFAFMSHVGLLIPNLRVQSKENLSKCHHRRQNGELCLIKTKRIEVTQLN